MEERPRIVITGSSGLIGSAVAARIARDAVVVGLDVKPGPWTSVIADVVDAGRQPDIFRRVDAIMHVAGLHAPHVGVRSDDDFARTNVRGTEAMLDAARRTGVRRFVFTSTTSVYGCGSRPGPGASWVTEDLPPNPEDVYDATKLEAERLCREAADSRLEVVVLRLSRCFPEPPPLRAFYRLYRGVDPRDATEGHWLAATRPLAGFHVLNLSAEPAFERADAPFLREDPWAVIDRRRPGLREEFDRRGWTRPAAIDRVYVIEKAKSVLGYRPVFGVEAVLEETSTR